ncbi:MAG: hypothetical protein ACOX2A_08355 [Tepidanaerobacteraceae bacterium]
METNIEDIYAVGDCADCKQYVDRKRGLLPDGVFCKYRGKDLGPKSKRQKASPIRVFWGLPSLSFLN